MHKSRFLLWLGWFYVLFVTLWLTLRLLFFDRVWWLALINSFAFFLFVPLPVLLAVSLGKRRQRLLLGLSIPTIAFVVLYGELFLPSFAPSGDGIAVMSFNTMLENQDYTSIAGAIRKAKPDVVGLQELKPNFATALLRDLAADYPYTTLVPGQVQTFSVGIFSRFPIETKSEFPIPGERYGIDVKTKKVIPLPEPRIAVRAILRVNGKQIQVIVAHLVHNRTLKNPLNQWASVAREHYKKQATQIQIIQQQLHQQELPFLLLCDCNLVDTSENYKQLAAFAKDSFREAGWGFGHTSVFIGSVPLQRLDYIWHSDEWVAIEAKVERDRDGSDHAPVVAKLMLR
jgi:vancomycin resistance protein VanJ